jgi:protein transport protein SEC61 subunit gamma-like protein
MPEVKSKFREYMRVLRIAKKPDREEFTMSTKICVLGIVVIGFIGFAIFMAFVLAGI